MNIQDIILQIENLALSGQRILVGVAGPPASGKSTLAEQLSDKIDKSILVPMDGFHLDNTELDQMGTRDRKGAPFTFDADGFISMINKIKIGIEKVDVPEFDRSLDSVVFKGLSVDETHKIIIIEGNYLFLDEDPWRALHPLFDLTVFLSPELSIIKSRLIQRWLEHGYSQHDAEIKAQSNDLPNAELVLAKSLQTDLFLNEVLV